MENTEKPANNVVHLRDFRDQEKTDDEFQEAPIFQCFVDEMKLSLHEQMDTYWPVSYQHLRAHETKANRVCRPLIAKKHN